MLVLQPASTWCHHPGPGCTIRVKVGCTSLQVIAGLCTSPLPYQARHSFPEYLISFAPVAKQGQVAWGSLLQGGTCLAVGPSWVGQGRCLSADDAALS